MRTTWVPHNLPFFVLCLVYVWLVVRPDLIYYAFGTLLPDAPQFATGWSFLRDSLGAPGGPVLYVSGLLSVGYYYAWLGAVVIVLTGFLLAELFKRHLARAGFTRTSLLTPLPAIILILIYGHYNHPLSVCLAVSLGLLLSLIFEWLPLRGSAVRGAVCCLTAVLGFWLGGAGTLLVFSLMTLVHEAIVHRGWPAVAVALPAGVGMAWILGEYVFLIPGREALLTLTPFAQSATARMDLFQRVLVFLLYGVAPGAVLFLWTGNRLFGKGARKPDARSGRTTRRKDKHAAPRREKPVWPIFMKPALAVVPIAALALGLYLSHKGLRKAYVLSNYYSCRKDWGKIIELSHRLPKDRNNPFVSHDIIRALYHTGRLPYDMFRFPLVPEGLLLTHEKQESDLTQSKLSDLFLELGHVNMAEKLASEVVATKRYQGVAIERLGWISLIKGRPAKARVYLEALRRDPVRRGRAESLLRCLDDGFPPDQAACIDRIRSYMADEAAGVTGGEPVDQMLAALLAHNPHNRMAFEYLMACYLVTGRVDLIAQNAARLRDLGYQGIPTLYEEAILIHRGTQGRALDAAGFSLSQETHQRYETFVRIRNSMQPHNQQAVLNHLIRDFGTSYFFYYSFGRVGLV